MNRKKFIEHFTVYSGALAAGSISNFPKNFYLSKGKPDFTENYTELAADLVIAGGGPGGCAAALSALRNDLKVILTEETDWILSH